MCTDSEGNSECNQVLCVALAVAKDQPPVGVRSLRDAQCLTPSLAVCGFVLCPQVALSTHARRAHAQVERV